jgi:hypothetical protein
MDAIVHLTWLFLLSAASGCAPIRSIYCSTLFYQDKGYDPLLAKISTDQP